MRQSHGNTQQEQEGVGDKAGFNSNAEDGGEAWYVHGVGYEDEDDRGGRCVWSMGSMMMLGLWLLCMFLLLLLALKMAISVFGWDVMCYCTFFVIVSWCQ